MELKNNFRIEEFLINPESIKNFEIMENRRQIGEGQVRKIHGTITSKKNPLGVLIVNEINGKWRLIDGNHRLEAVKRFYTKESNKNVKIQCVLRIYKNLSKEEERQVYSDEAKRRNESHEDRLNMYKEIISFWKLTQDNLNKFPCLISIYPSTKGLRFRTILDSLATVKTEQRNGYVPRYLGKEDLIEFAKDLNYEDFTKTKDFIILFQEIFGDVGKENIYCRRQGFLPIFDIYIKNIENIDRNKLKKRMEEIVGKSDILMYLNMQGREAQQKIRELMIGYINKGHSRNLVI